MKNLDYYLSLPYTIELVREDETTWFARVVELPGCMTEGDSAAEAADMIQDAMASWIEVALEDGDVIPEPRPYGDYSGKFVVRVPKSLHGQLVDTARAEGVSLNQYIITALARAVGGARPVQKQREYQQLFSRLASIESLLSKLQNTLALSWAGKRGAESTGYGAGLAAAPTPALHEMGEPYGEGSEEEAETS